MTDLLPPGEPVYPPSLAAQAWGAPQWQQQWVEASQRWAIGSVFVLEKNGASLSREDRYVRRACMPGLTPWLENLTVRVYDQHESPQPFASGLAVDPIRRQVWVERSLVERQADSPEDTWTRDSWHTQGWAEFWVRVASAMGAPESVALPLLKVACRRERLNRNARKVLWPEPEVFGALPPVLERLPDVQDEPAETLLKSKAQLEGWELVRNSQQVWASESTSWTDWARAARWMSFPLTVEERAQRADVFLERSVRADHVASMMFWVSQVAPDLEKRLPSLLGRVRVASMVAPLVAKGANPNAKINVDFEGHLSVLANAVIYAPSVVGALVSAGAGWDTVPNRIDTWENLAGQLGQANSWEWAGILEGLPLLPRTPIEGHVPAKMVENFFKNHRYRTTDKDQAAHVLKSTLAWMIEVSPDLDLMPTLAIFVKASTPAYDESLELVLDHLKGVDLNKVTVNGQDRLPMALVKHGTFAWKFEDSQWLRHTNLWEAAGVSWKREAEELRDVGNPTMDLYQQLRRPQEAREKSQALEETLGQPSSSPSRPRM